MIYMDNAATSWPKPPAVLKAMTDALESAGGNPGRSGHSLSVAAARLVYGAREEIAEFFGCPDPLRVIFTLNATHAINQALYGLLKPGDSVDTSSMEHNAVMRPLRNLESKGGKITVVKCAAHGTLARKTLARAVKKGTKLVVLTHASNVCGTILPVTEAAKIAHAAGAILLVDASQTAGHLPIDMKTMGIDLLAFTGHKCLLGPTGIGCLLIGDRVDTAEMSPLIYGGTGSQSDKEIQPEFLPDKFESGTPNLAGIAGLQAGLRYLKKMGLDEVTALGAKQTQQIIAGLVGIKGLSIQGVKDPLRQVSIVSLTVTGKHVSEIGHRLDKEFGILTRVGLHCAPAAHHTLGTFPGGTVRLAPGVFTSKADIDIAIAAIRKVCEL